MTGLDINKKGYCLSLDDGNRWLITGYGAGAKFADKLADVMRLGNCQFDTSSKLMFFAEDYNEQDRNQPEFMGLDCPHIADNWRTYNFDYLSILQDITFSNIICKAEIDKYQKSRTRDTNVHKANIDDFRNQMEYMVAWHSLQPIYQKSMKMGGLPFHAGLAEYNGQGILLSGKSGVGKSTCCGRLPSYWNVLCDDETLVILGEDGNYRVHPFPTWSEYFRKGNSKTWQVEYSVPVCAIFFLEQSEIDEVIPLKPDKSVILITNSAIQACDAFLGNIKKEYQVDFMKDAFNNAVDMVKQIPAYRLRVSLTGRFWEEIEKVI